MNVEVQATVAFQVTVSFQLTAKLPLTVAQFSEVFQVVVKLFNVVFQLTHRFVALMSPAVIAPVKEDCPFTANHSKVALSEVREVISQAVALKLVIVASVEVNVAMSQEVAVKFQVTVKSAQVVTSQVNVEVQVTSKFQPTDAFQEVSKVAVLTSVAETFVVFTSVALTVSILPVVALTVVAVTVVQVNVQSAVILPVKVTSPLIVCRLTLDKSSSILSIALSSADISREIL